MTWRAPLYFLFGLFLGGYAAWANAGYALVDPPAGLSFNPNSGYNWKPDISTPPANGSWSAHGFMRYGGKNIPVPASWGAAANAATFAKNTLRFNPWLFVGTTVMTIAIDAGFEYVGDQWMYNDVPEQTYEPGAGTWRLLNNNPFSMTGTSDALRAAVDAHYAAQGLKGGIAWSRQGGPNYGELNWYRWYTYETCTAGCPALASVNVVKSGWDCPAGYVEEGGVCIPLPQLRPATEQDWNAFPVGPLTDTQLDELSRLAPGGLPVTNPELEPVVAPLGNPYTDPVTGEQWRDMIRITPDPTPSSPLRVRLDPYREPLSTPDPTPENPNPVPEPDPTRPNETLPEMWPLFCDWAGPVCELIDWFREPFVVPEPEEMPELEIDQPSLESFGLPTTAGCPAPRVVSIGFGTFNLSYDPFCQLAEMIRPLVLVTAYLFAGFILLGVRR